MDREMERPERKGKAWNQTELNKQFGAVSTKSNLKQEL